MKNVKVGMLAALCAIVLFSENGFSKCFNFTTSRGPTRIGSVNFDKYRATSVCIRNVRGFGHSYVSLSLADKEGDLIQLATEAAVGRCGPYEYCMVLTGKSGNALGANLSEEEATSISVRIDAAKNSESDPFVGTLRDDTNSIAYPITEIQN